MKAIGLVVGAFVGTTVAHGTVQSFKTDGVSNGGWLLDYYYMIKNGQTPPKVAGWYAENLDNGFVAPDAYQSTDIICHKAAKPGETSAKVAAGGTVEFQWTDWPHPGPMFTYVAKCSNNDCTTVDKTSLKWVKIDEAGIDYATQEWAATKMQKNGNKWTTKVPASLAPGKYVFRHETIGVHGSGSANGAQNYPQCVNIEVTGSGTANPTGVAYNQLYTASHPGILFNPYTTITNYVMPGPTLWKG
jgi:hypothetical protein